MRRIKASVASNLQLLCLFLICTSVGAISSWIRCHARIFQRYNSVDEKGITIERRPQIPFLILQKIRFYSICFFGNFLQFVWKWLKANIVRIMARAHGNTIRRTISYHTRWKRENRLERTNEDIKLLDRMNHSTASRLRIYQFSHKTLGADRLPAPYKVSSFSLSPSRFISTTIFILPSSHSTSNPMLCCWQDRGKLLSPDVSSA